MAPVSIAMSQKKEKDERGRKITSKISRQITDVLGTIPGQRIECGRMTFLCRKRRGAIPRGNRPRHIECMGPGGLEREKRNHDLRFPPYQEGGKKNTSLRGERERQEISGKHACYSKRSRRQRELGRKKNLLRQKGMETPRHFFFPREGMHTGDAEKVTFKKKEEVEELNFLKKKATSRPDLLH